MRRRALLCVVGATAFAGCSGRLDDSLDTTDAETATQIETTADSDTTESETTTDPQTTTEVEPALELASHELVRTGEGSDDELAVVVGTVRNPTDRTVTAVTVSVTFEDAHGAILDRTSARVSELSPGRSWSFELVYPGTGEDASAVANYALTVTTDD